MAKKSLALILRECSAPSECFRMLNIDVDLVSSTATPEGAALLDDILNAEGAQHRCEDLILRQAFPADETKTS